GHATNLSRLCSRKHAKLTTVRCALADGASFTPGKPLRDLTIESVAFLDLKLRRDNGTNHPRCKPATTEAAEADYPTASLLHRNSAEVGDRSAENANARSNGAGYRGYHRRTLRWHACARRIRT